MAASLEIDQVFNSQRSRDNLQQSRLLKTRIEKLTKLRTWIHENREQIQQALFNDFKKPAEEVDLSEIYVVLSEIKHALKHLKAWVKPQKMDTNLALLGSKSYVYHEPRGVCLILAPWNFPFNLTVGPLISAIAAGNNVILKPSELTPNCADLIKTMVVELFQPQEVAVFTGDKEVASKLLALPFDHIFFTGSPRVGKIVMEQAAKHLTSVTLELGGKSPAVVDFSADLEDTAEKLVWGKFLNGGQTCIAPDYLLVDERIEDQLLEHMTRYIDRMYNADGEGIASSSAYARIIDAAHFGRLKGLLDEALKQGAELEFGGNANAEDHFLMPTVISNVAADSPIMQQEIFGPILPVISFQKLSEAIELINQGTKPLALYMFSKSDDFNQKILQQTTSGSVAINDCVVQFMNPNLPFGGVNYSGFGKSHGYSGFQAFSNQKSVLKQKTGLTSVKPLYPPYTDLTNKAIDFLLKYL
jgi:aldehyde dehydrogenase (NAD+)